MFVDYDVLVQNPKPYFRKVADEFGLNYGDLTDSILDDVYIRPKKRDFPFDSVDPELYGKAMDIYATCRNQSVQLGD